MLNEAILERQNKQLRERIGELEETVRHLQETVAAKWEEPLPTGWPYLTRGEERIARRLLAAGGNLVTKDQLYTALYDTETDREMQIVVVLISHLRRKLPAPVTIENIHGRGYRLINVPVTKVNKPFRDGAQNIARASSEQRAA